MSALEAGHRLGQYRVIRLLGEGGMGAVYEARHESLDRRVAVKTLHAEVAANQTAVTRFFNEAKTLSRLEHPSIVQVSDFGTAPDGTAYCPQGLEASPPSVEKRKRNGLGEKS
jgi:serine/threonine protein kinase